MKTLRCICLGLLLILGLAYGQTNSFVKTYAAERGIQIGSCLVTEDHGFIVAGGLWNNDNPNLPFGDAFAIRADSAGNVLWSRALNCVADTQDPNIEERIGDIASAPINGWLLGGHTLTDSGNGWYNSPYFVRLGLVGDTLWTRSQRCTDSHRFSEINAVNATTNNTFVALGTAAEPGLFGFVPVVIEMGQNGDSLHAFRYNLVDTVLDANEILVLPNGAYLCVMKGVSETVLLRLDGNLQPLWCKKYRWSGSNYTIPFPQKAMALPDGSVVITGFVLIGTSWNASLMKIDPVGNVVWAHSYIAGNHSVRAHALAQAVDGGWLIGAQNTDSHTGRLIKTDSLGNFEWAREYGNQGIRKVTVLPNGGVLLAAAEGDIRQSVYVAQTDAAYHVPCYDTLYTMQTTNDTYSVTNTSAQAVPYQGRWSSAPTVQRPLGGPITDCGVVGVAPARAVSHKLYPNPMAHTGTLELPATLQLDGAELQLVDAYGHVAWRRSGVTGPAISLDVQGLAPGVYAYRLLQGGQMVFSGRLIVVH